MDYGEWKGGVRAAIMLVDPLTENAFRRVVAQLAARRVATDVAGLDTAVLTA